MYAELSFEVEEHLDYGHSGTFSYHPMRVADLAVALEQLEWADL